MAELEETAFVVVSERKSVETWKAIPGFPDYEVSDQGSVISYKKRGAGGVKETPHILRPSTGRYRGVNLSNNGVVSYRRISSLIMLAFVGPPPEGMEICHNNGESTDDRLSNLRYDTHLNNMREGRGLKISDADVVYIRELVALGVTLKRAAGVFGITLDYAGKICRGEHRQEADGPITCGMRRKLTDKQVAEIRRERQEQGTFLRVLGEKYNVSESHISYIIRGLRR